MLALAADENFSGAIVRGLLRRRPDTDLVRIQDAGLRGSDDPSVLAWAAKERRVLRTHDENTLVGHAYDLVEQGRSMVGVFVVRQDVSPGRVIDDLLLLIDCSRQGEWIGQVRFLPL